MNNCKHTFNLKFVAFNSTSLTSKYVFVRFDIGKCRTNHGCHSFVIEVKNI